MSYNLVGRIWITINKFIWIQSTNILRLYEISASGKQFNVYPARKARHFLKWTYDAIVLVSLPI